MTPARSDCRRTNPYWRPLATSPALRRCSPHNWPASSSPWHSSRNSSPPNSTSCPSVRFGRNHCELPHARPPLLLLSFSCSYKSHHLLGALACPLGASTMPASASTTLCTQPTQVLWRRSCSLKCCFPSAVRRSQPSSSTRQKQEPCCFSNRAINSSVFW